MATDNKEIIFKNGILTLFVKDSKIYAEDAYGVEYDDEDTPQNRKDAINRAISQSQMLMNAHN